MKFFLCVVGSVVVWYFDFGFVGFVIVWYVLNLVGGIMYWWFVVCELCCWNIYNVFKLNLFEFVWYIKGVWSFVWLINIVYFIWLVCNLCSIVLVGIVLGFVVVGLFKIVMIFFDVVGTLVGLLGKSFYLEVMCLDLCIIRLWLLGVKFGLLVGGIGILVVFVVLIVGKLFILLVFGVKYFEVYDLI